MAKLKVSFNGIELGKLTGYEVSGSGFPLGIKARSQVEANAAPLSDRISDHLDGAALTNYRAIVEAATGTVTHAIKDTQAGQIDQVGRFAERGAQIFNDRAAAAWAEVAEGRLTEGGGVQALIYRLLKSVPEEARPIVLGLLVAQVGQTLSEAARDRRLQINREANQAAIDGIRSGMSGLGAALAAADLAANGALGNMGKAIQEASRAAALTRGEVRQGWELTEKDDPNLTE